MSRLPQTPNDWLEIVAVVKREQEYRGLSFGGSAEWEGRAAMAAYWAPSKDVAIDVLTEAFEHHVARDDYGHIVRRMVAS